MAWCSTLPAPPAAQSSTTTGSHLGIDLEALQNGVVLQNGAYIYHADMYIHGGIRSSSSPPPQGTTWAALTITGQVPSGHPGAGNNSFIEKSKQPWARPAFRSEEHTSEL